MFQTGWQETQRASSYELRSTPRTYADQLARYMKDASTIEVLTRREFGRSPSRDEIGRMIANHRKPAKPPIWENATMARESDKNDGLHYKVPGLVKLPPIPVFAEPKPVKEKKAKQPKFVKPEYIAPEIAPDDLYPVRLIKLVASDFRITPADILGTRRCRRFAQARAVIIFILRERNPSVWSYPQIGRLLNKDHSSIINLWRQRDDMIQRHDGVASSYALRKGEE